MFKQTKKTIRTISVASKTLGVLRFVLFLIALTGVFLFTRVGTPERASAATSSYLNFQARLLSQSGAIVPDGTYNIEFKLYDSLAAGASAQGVCVGGGTDDCLWLETRTGGNKVTVKSGYLSVYLGQVTALPNINWDQDLYLTMNIGGIAGPTWDGEMSPRLKLTAVPYAFSAGQLAKVSGANTGTLSFGTITNNPVIQLPDIAGTNNVLLQSGTTLFTQGSIPFTDANGRLQQDNANFFFDDTNNTLGIGTTRTGAIDGTGNARLIVKGSGTTSSTSSLNVTDSSNNSLFYIRDDGNVGIGTTAPGANKLLIKGGILKIENSGNANGFSIDPTGTISGIGNALTTLTASGYSLGTLVLDAPRAVTIQSTLTSDSAAYINFRTAGSERIRIENGGNVGIGTTIPANRLDVAGSTRLTASGTSVLTGSIDPTASTSVTGVGTLFTTQLVVGDRITVSGETRTVTVITSDTALTVDAAFADNGNDTSVDRLPASLSVRSSANAPQLVVSDQGNVGIGTTSPSQMLEVNGNIQVNGTGSILFAGTNAYPRIARSGNDLQWQTNTAGIAVTLLDSGFVGIGDAAPAYLLTVGNGDLFGVQSDASLIWEGSSADGFETILSVVNPTADLTFQLPDAAAGTYAICTSANNCSGLGAYIQNSTTLQSPGNFAIQSVADGSVSGLIRARASQTADLLQFQNSAGTNPLSGINSAGNLYYRDGTSGFVATLGLAGLSADRSILLPNAGGTICTTSGNCIGAGGAGDIFNGGQTGPITIGTNDNTTLTLETNNTPRINILGAGNVGIGTISPTGLLQVTQATTGPGTVATNGTSTLTGTNTQFLNTFKVGDTITVSGETVRTIATISSNTSLTTTVAFSTTASGLSYTLTGGDRLTVLGNGNVGIGTTVPDYKLEVGGANGALARLMSSAGSSWLQFTTTTNSNNWLVGVGTETGGANEFGIRDLGIGQTRLLINNSGNVGIGTTAPANRLDVAGSTRLTASATSVITGSIDATASASVTGVGTLFTTQLVVGDRITVTGETRTVTAITSDTSLTVDTAFTDTANDTSVDRLPAALSVRSSANAPQMVVSDQGYVGIGTAAPTTKLQVADGDISITSISSIDPSYTWFFQNRRARGTPSSPTAVQSGDTLGGYMGMGYDGTNYVGGGFIKFEAEGTISTGIVPGNFSVFTTDSAGNSGQRLIVNSAGNVGINTTGPDRKLDVLDASNPQLRLTHTDGSVYSELQTGANGGLAVTSSNLTATGAYGVQGTFTVAGTAASQTYYGNKLSVTNNQTTNANTLYGQHISFTDAGSLANTLTGLYVDATTANSADTTYAAVFQGGNVGIGTAAPTTKLDVYGGNIGLTDDYALVWGDQSSLIYANSTSDFIKFRTGGTDNVTINSFGNVGIGTTSPSGLLQITQGTTGPGTVTTNGSVTLTGTNTQFLNTFKIGDTITVSGETVRTINNISSNTSMTVSVAFSTSASGLSYTLTGGDRVTVLANGNVGIGTATPGSLLDVVRAGAGTIASFGANSVANLFTIGYNNGTGAVEQTSSIYGPMQLQTQSNNHILLMPNGTGNIGINTTGPDRKLDVLDASNPQIRLTYTDGSVYTDLQTDSSGNLTIDATGTKTVVADDLQITGNDILDSSATSRVTLGATTSINGNLGISGANTFTSGTGTVLLQGNTDIAATVSLATRQGTTYTTAGSANDVAISTASLYRLDTSGAAQVITGIAAGRDGQHLTLVNTDATNTVTLNNLDGASSAANQISTGTGANLVIPIGASVNLIYDATSSLWRVIGGVATTGGGANQQLSNLSGTVAINTHLLTAGDNAIDLGSSANSFRTLYADTSVLTPTLDTQTATALNIGTATQNALTLGRVGATTSVNGSTITITNNAGTDLTNLLTGNLKVGDGAPTITLNGEDAYIEGTLEVDGTVQLDGAVTATANISQTGATTFSTGTGAVSLNGDTTIAANKNFVIATGTGTYTQTYNGTGNALSVTSSSTTDLNKALNIVQNGATTGTDYAGYYSNTGAGTTNVGLYATATGATNNYAAIFENGNVGVGTAGPQDKLEVAGNLRMYSATTDNSILFQDDNVNHGLTGLITEANGASVHTRIRNVNGSAGGTEVLGVTDQDSFTALHLYGVLGVTDPTDTVPAITLNGAKKNTTDVQALGSLETVLQVQNNTSALMTVLGSGNVGIGTTSTTRKLHVAGGVAAAPSAFGTGSFVRFESTNTAALDIGADPSSPFAIWMQAGGSGLYPLALNPLGGNVGIGTTAPTTLFANTATNRSSATDSQNSNASGLTWAIGGAGYAANINNTASGTARNGLLIHTGASSTDAYALAVESNNTSRLVVRADGNVGIGTTAPGYKLEVAGVTKTQDLITQSVSLGGSSYSTITPFTGHAGYANFTGGIGTGGSDSQLNALRLTNTGNLVNIGSIQAGETLLTRAGTFAAKVDYTTGSGPTDIALGDVNGDGKADMVVANQGSTSASVFINNGTGTFAAKVDYTTGSLPRDIALGDVNGDGKADMVVTNQGSTSASVFINNGTGTFAAKVDYTTGSAPTGIALGDVNGDGKADMVVANSSSTSASVFINNGTGTFAAKVDYTTGSAPTDIALGDVNGDGKADMVVANNGTTTASVFINNGTGIFAAKVDYTTGSAPFGIALGDVNGDGKADMVVANSSSTSASVFINNGTGTFAAKVDYTTGSSPRDIALGDVNGDGKADMVVAHQVSTFASVFINNGTGTFAAKVDYTTGSGSTGIALGDVNGDGKADMVATQGGSSASVFINTASTIFYAQASTGRIGIGTAAPSYDLSFGGEAARTIQMEVRTGNAAGNNLTISAGGAGAGASPFGGGQLILQGGTAAGTGNAAGGAVTIAGGAGVGTGTQGLVNLSTTAFSSASVQTFASPGVASITAGNVDLYSSLPVTASTTGVIVSVPDPAQATIGRVLYLSARSGSNDFTLRLNAARTPIDIAMKANSTATLIWNGTDWTAAGASSSTDLQSAYNNTLTSAGGAELVLNAAGGAADGLTIRNNATTPISGGILEVQSSIGTNLFSVNNFGTELAANGGSETAASFNTDWTVVGSASRSRTTTAGQFVTGLAGASVTTTAAANDGVRNNLNANPVVSTTYQVSFAAKLAAGTFSTLDVRYSRDGGTDLEPCTSYSTQTLSTSVWTKITCTITTDATTATNPDLIIRQTDATARTIYIDNLSFIRNDSTTQPSNVQVGGGVNGGPVTLFTLDRSTAPPVANGDTTYLGSMYYDTTTGRIQCYESDGWGACGSAPDNIIVLTPEYAGAVLNGNGVGTLTADFCANSAALTVGTLCGSNNSRQFYRWTSPQATEQIYSMYVSYKLPSTFKTFNSDNTITLTALSDNVTNGFVTYEVFRSTGSAITRCYDGITNETAVTSTVNTWQTVPINGAETGCGFVGGDNIIFKINVKSKSSANVYVENLNFTYTNN